MLIGVHTEKDGNRSEIKLLFLTEDHPEHSVLVCLHWFQFLYRCCHVQTSFFNLQEVPDSLSVRTTSLLLFWDSSIEISELRIENQTRQTPLRNLEM